MSSKKILQFLRFNSRQFSKTVDKHEIQQFQRNFDNEWWNELAGPVKPLHSLNKLRIPLIRDGLINTGSIQKFPVCPLKDVAILDVGCGGGILSEPLARLGALITGLDANPQVIEQAEIHAQSQNLNIQYISETIEEHAEKCPEKYDAIVASEILEHVTQKEEFLKACLKCLKAEGSFFTTTMSQTFLADFAGIFLCEDVLGILPKGTHDYEKFIQPFKLQRLLEDENCKTVLVHGMFYNYFANTWHWCCDTSVNYCLHAVKLPKSF